jgi:calcineurin-like phosphoesterase family protein
MSNKVWFSADPHFNHDNIRRLAGRPFDSCEEMNNTIIDNYNRLLDPGDRLYILGDFAWCRAQEIRQRIRCKNVYLIRGNHDRDENADFIWVRDYKRIKVDDQIIILFHYPIASWDCAFYGSWHLHGHTHSNFPTGPDKFRLDVGVDEHNYEPISFDQVKAIMDSKKNFMLKRFGMLESGKHLKMLGGRSCSAESI